MRILKRLLLLALLIVVFVAGMMFTFQNTEQVAVDLFFVKLPAAPLSFWILSSFAVGGLLGVFFTLGIALRLKTGKLVLQRRLSKAEKAAGQEAEAA